MEIKLPQYTFLPQVAYALNIRLPWKQITRSLEQGSVMLPFHGKLIWVEKTRKSLQQREQKISWVYSMSSNKLFRFAFFLYKVITTDYREINEHSTNGIP